MSRFTRSLKAEFRKLVATKMWWILGIVIAAYSALMAGTFAAIFTIATDEMPSPMLDAEMTGKLVMSAVPSFGYVVPLLLGAIMATGELRHKILGLAFIAEPRRHIVLVAKIIVLLTFGAILALAGFAGAVVTVVWFMPEGWLTAETILLCLRSIATLALWAAIGFGVGLIVRNQAITIVLMLVFTQFIEPMLRMGAMFWEWSANIAKFLPGSASDGFVGMSILGDMGVVDDSMTGTSTTTFGIGIAALVLIGYAVVTVAVGWAARLRRDIL